MVEMFDDFISDIEVLDAPKKDSRVYIPEETLEDILALNDLQKEIDKKEAERDAKDAEVKDIEEKQKAKSDELKSVNTGDQVQEAQSKMAELEVINSESKKLKAELEEIYAALRSLESDKKALEEQTRLMVEEFTKAYNEKKEKHVKLVNDYIEFGRQSDFDEASRLADELLKFKVYDSFEDILKQNEAKTEEKEETKVEAKEEVKEEAKEEVTKEEFKEPEFSKVEVDEIEAPAVSEEQKVENPSFDSIAVEDAPVEAKGEAPKAIVSSIYKGQYDVIADTNKKGKKATIETFNPGKAVVTPLTNETISNEEIAKDAAVLTMKPAPVEQKVA